MIKGYIHSFQSLGTVDGPGVRFVAFLQGCPLRCKCCHNPDTWEFGTGMQLTAEEIVQKALRYKEYYGKDGGITLSGGEPLMQPQFVKDVFILAKDAGLNTCLDTSGCILNDEVAALLSYTDHILLDIKYTDNALYRENVGSTLDSALSFLAEAQKRNIPVTLRQVIIPTVNDNEDNIQCLKKIAVGFSCVCKIELLPFRKICEVKYENMGIEFPFAHIPEPTLEQMQELNNILKTASN